MRYGRITSVPRSPPASWSACADWHFHVAYVVRYLMKIGTGIMGPLFGSLRRIELWLLELAMFVAPPRSLAKKFTYRSQIRVCGRWSPQLFQGASETNIRYLPCRDRTCTCAAHWPSSKTPQIFSGLLSLLPIVFWTQHAVLPSQRDRGCV